MTKRKMSEYSEFHKLADLSDGLLRKLADGLTAHIYAGDHAMLSIVDIEPHAAGDVHSHPQEQWGVLLEGAGVRLQGGDRISVSAGDFWRTPPGVEHGFEAGPNGARVLDIFSPPRDEYKSHGVGFAASAQGQSD